MVMSGRRRRMLVGAGLVMASCAVCGCGSLPVEGDGSGSSGEAGTPSDKSVRFSAVWHSGPHMDLMSPLGTFVRAYVEDAAWAFNSWDEEQLSRAVVGASDFDIEKQLVSTVPTGPLPEYQGAVDYHVAEVSGPAERTRVTVCRTDPRLGGREFKSDEDFFRGVEGEPPSVFPSLLVISQVGQAPPAGMAGTENVPPSEAFGEWRALRYTHSPRREERAEAQGKCNALLGLPPEYPDNPISETAVPSVPEVDPSPGWPVGSASVVGS